MLDADLLLLKQEVNLVREVGRRHQTFGNMCKYVYKTVLRQEYDYVSCSNTKLWDWIFHPLVFVLTETN